MIHSCISSKTILLLTNNDVGLYKFRKELLMKLISLEWIIYVVLPKGEYFDQLQKIGCKCIDVAIDRRGINPIKDFCLFFRYLRLVKQIIPTVVLTYTIKPNIYGGIACRLSKKTYLANITGLGTSIENPGVLQRFVLQLYRIGVNGSRCTFFQNKNNMDYMVAYKVGGKKKCLLPGSGVDLQSHYYRKYPSTEANISFISIMRIMRDKGIEEFLECAKQIKPQYPFTNFVLVGDYDDESYREQVERTHAEGIIEYLGYRNDIDELIAQNHCLINPSYHEGMSNVLLEAAACGRPVIASQVSGCVETFDEGISGFGFEVCNTAALVECVERFINLPYEQKISMGVAGRCKVEKSFDRNIVISAYVDELEKIQHE